MAEHSLDWIIIRNLISANFIFNKKLSKYNLFSYLSFFPKNILVKSLEGSSAISHTISENCLPSF